MLEKTEELDITSKKHKQELRNKILKILEEQGFKISDKCIKPADSSKLAYHNIHTISKFEKTSQHKKFIQSYLNKAKKYCRDGRNIDPAKISLELREVQPRSFEENLFKWWNLVWWSIPYQHPYGRQMRFFLWDTAHDAPFGLIYLQSPILRMSVRDKALGIPKEELDLWINKSMYAQRVGALPPYNDLLGGKMVALALSSNEIRDVYKKKYALYRTLIKKRIIDSNLLFITTTSAFGKSSLYNRLKYKGEVVAERLGYTKGSGSFHIPDDIYQKILELLSCNGVDITRGFGHGPSKKLRFISRGLSYLGLSKYAYHGVKREFYLFPLVENLREVIQHKEEPQYFDRPFDELASYWKERRALPRAERKKDWKNFKVDDFFKKVERILEET